MGVSIAVFFFVLNWDVSPTLLFATNHENSAEKVAARNFDLSSNIDPRTNRSCLPFIFYDKPVKTSSTSVTKALGIYFSEAGEEIMPCVNRGNCSIAADEMCAGFRPPAHLIEHITVNSTMVDCLHRMGFYHVTSIREPKARILSAYKFNKLTSGRHNGIDPDAPFEEFLRLFPRCALYRYYDGEKGHCGDDRKAMERRAANIAERMDEVIELSEEPNSHVYGMISKYLTVTNVATLKTSNSQELVIPDEIAEPEYVLYNKLRERREQLTQQPQRMRPCAR